MDTLITGTATGIGCATAAFFLERGHRVWGIDIAEPTLDHENYQHFICDVSDAASLPDGLEPEVVISNAGVQGTGDDIAVNLHGTINVVEKYAFAGDATGGRRELGLAPAPRIRSVVCVGSAYTKNVAGRLAPQAICNSVDPGGVLTELNLPVMEDERLWGRIMDLTPLRRWAMPEEIAEWIYFVAVTNRFMTGQNLLIDGGEAGRTEFVWPD